MPSFANRVRYALGFRIAAWYTVISIASAFVLFGLTYALLARSLAERDRQLIDSALRRYATAYVNDGVDELQRLIDTDRQGSRAEGLLVRFTGRGVQLLFYARSPSGDPFDLADLDRAAQQGVGWSTFSGAGGAAFELETARLFDGTVVQVGKSAENRSEILDRFRTLMALGVLASLVIAVSGGVLVTRRALAPLNELIETVQEIVETGRLAARVPVRFTGDALDQLGDVFNAMLARIEDLIAAMRGSLDDVAHDLRTPLTRLRSVAETALRRQDATAESYKEALSDCLEEADRVVTMLATMMDISEAETGVLKLAVEPVRITSLVGEAMALYEDVAEERGIALTAAVPDDLVVPADAARLRRVLANLLDNAVKYTTRDGRVELTARREGREALVAVHDTGCGIAAEDLPRIWDRLYRGDKSRKERGLGLGLSVVRAIVHAHGGRVVARSDVGKGSTFEVYLPVEP
ncbi:MAG: ATP-binding protein [Vicinamibacterales bacterium]